MTVQKEYTKPLIIGYDEMVGFKTLQVPPLYDTKGGDLCKVSEMEYYLHFTYDPKGYNPELVQQFVEEMEGRAPFDVTIQLPDEIEWVYPDWIWWVPKKENEKFYRYLGIGHERSVPVPPIVIPKCHIDSINQDTGEVEISSSWFNKPSDV